MSDEATRRAVEAALEPLLGVVDVTVGERLPGSDRNRVLRVVAQGRDGRPHRLVVKTAVDAGDGAARAEAALRLLTARAVPGAVRLVAAGSDPVLLVLDDLGPGPTLADRLLGAAPRAAETSLLAWAGALGSFHAGTTGLRDAFAEHLAALSPLGAPSLDTSAETVGQTAAVLRRVLPRLDVDANPAAWDELGAIAADLDVSRPGRPGAMTPGDICPDNAIDTADGPVLIDFEGAEYRHVAWDAAYLRVPWPSCWCGWLLPAPLAAAALERWRAAVAPTLPVVRTAPFDIDLARAAVAWVFISAGWFLEEALDGDRRPADPARHAIVPTRRALLQHRLRWAAEQTDAPLPALRHLAAVLHAATLRQWGPVPLPLAPAFR
ncbi:hypothetical protein [Pseudofrankia asymbiotica]|uniref:Aminoglycoside phosphotransferase domain-containing protein n=1 Tax=Pseudofrankia asymbiotica TaxID=1834516 RepID=A0A1V2II19_9ACTN|nr:hypothetical protein [Pseudofrankia asymbiotica]ONH32579.1 hypothetical protein BL253_04445 [Pseudofrankia asymbiotica]